MKFLALAAVCYSLALSAFAEETNVIYLPVDPKGYFGEAAKARAHVEQMEAVKGRPECRPAEADPEGHWGAPTAGLQLSIRFQTNVFASGQPIAIRVVLRNVTTNSMTLPNPGPWAVDFSALNEKQHALIATNRAKWYTYSGSAFVGLPARRQIAYDYRLDDIFDLRNPGNYYISAVRAKADSPGLPQISSGTAMITIVEPASR
jgi:hypothetical protein